jgi:ATP-dependent helicase/nuclease subunit A
MNRDIPDMSERLAALETTRSCLVEAPAGSGKTHLLTTRFLKLLGEVNHPQEILALTFTRKAAGEMRSRVTGIFLRALDGASSNDADEAFLLDLARKALQRQIRHRSLLFSPDGLNIMTFHSFCYHISQRAPLESSLPPDFNILEETVQPVLIAETLGNLRRKIFRLRPDHPARKAFEKRLFCSNNRWSRFESEMKDVILNRDRFEHLVHEVARHGLSFLPALLKKRLGHHVEMLLQRLSESFSQSPVGRHWEPLVLDLSLHGTPDSSLPAAAIPGVSWACLPEWQATASLLLTKDGRPRRRFGFREGFPPNFASTPWPRMISEMPRRAADLLHQTKDLPLIEDPIPDLEDLKDVILLSSEVLSEYEDRCRIRHVIDFTGLEQAALRALSGETPADIQLYLDYRVKHLLVDEFQDTSLNQWELIQRLMDGWEPGDGRTFFMVGDPKQSIYGFRNAEVRLFLQAKKGVPISGMGMLPVRNLSLNANFRSAPALIDWINGLFGDVVMSSPKEESDEVAFRPSIAAGKERQGPSSLSLHLFSADHAERSKADEATWLAERVRELMVERDSPSSIAVLLFNRNRLNHYLKALKEIKIPVQVQEGLPLSERPEVRHLLQIARAVARPHDDLAWASLVRSPWFWCDLMTLHEIALKEGALWSERLYAMASEKASFDALRRSLDHALQRTGRDSLSRVVKRFWEDLDGPRVTASLYGMRGVANCIHFFNMMDHAEEGIPLLTLNRLEHMLHSLHEPPDPTMSRAAVQLMTVHRAKGLEFDAVFLPYLDWRPLASGPKRPPPYLAERLPGEEGQVLLAMGPDSRLNRTTAVFRILNSLRKERSWGEAKRLFYVAATRARKFLFLSGVLKKNDNILDAADGSVLRWVFDYERLHGKSWDTAEAQPCSALHVVINPRRGNGSPLKPSMDVTVPEPCPFEPEGLPYVIQHPSAIETDRETLVSETSTTGSPFVSREAAASGTVIHRLIHTCLRGQRLPSSKVIALALREEGVSESSTARLADEIREEVSAALNDPFIKQMTDKKNPLLKSEWGLDESGVNKIIRSGTLDLVVFDGLSWWVIDFKSSRPSPGEAIDDFIARQTDLHRAQLTAYRSMLASQRSIPLDDIHVVIYFTFLRIWRDVGQKNSTPGK